MENMRIYKTGENKFFKTPSYQQFSFDLYPRMQPQAIHIHVVVVDVT